MVSEAFCLSTQFEISAGTFCKHSSHSELVLFISVFLLLFWQRLTTHYLHYLFLQRARQRRVQFRIFHILGYYVSIIATGTNALLVDHVVRGFFP